MKVFMSICLTVLFLTVSIQAGLVVKMSQETKGMNVKSEQTMFIEKDRLRMEMSGDEEYQTVIFRGDKNVFWVINNDKKTYFEMTQEDIAKLKSQMDNMQKMMMEQMKNMPAEQRKMMEDMMPSSMPNSEIQKTVYTKKAEGIKVGKWTTTHYEGNSEGKKSEEIWAAEWSQVGFDRSDFQVMNKMAEFFSALSQDASSFMKVGSEEWEKEMGISGIPVRWMSFMPGGEVNEGTLNDISQKNLESPLFELPAGFKKDQSPWDNQGKGMNPYMQE